MASEEASLSPAWPVLCPCTRWTAVCNGLRAHTEDTLLRPFSAPALRLPRSSRGGAHARASQPSGACDARWGLGSAGLAVWDICHHAFLFQVLPWRPAEYRYSRATPHLGGSMFLCSVGWLGRGLRRCPGARATSEMPGSVRSPGAALGRGTGSQWVSLTPPGSWGAAAFYIAPQEVAVGLSPIGPEPVFPPPDTSFFLVFFLGSLSKISCLHAQPHLRLCCLGESKLRPMSFPHPLSIGHSRLRTSSNVIEGP